MRANNFIKETVIRRQETLKDSGVFKLKLTWSGLKPEAGQFVMLAPTNETSVMPRPFSIAEYESTTLTLYVGAVGKNTRSYAKLSKGDEIQVLGPLGSPINNDDFRNYVLIGGGIGIAGIMLLAERLRLMRKSVTVLLGAKEKRKIFSVKYFLSLGCKVRYICETGEKHCGLVTDLLNKISPKEDARIIACGPKPMLKCVADIAREKNIPCTVLLEEVMACGIGSCKGCAVFGKDGTVKHICSDGPAFDVQWINWEKLVPTRIEVIAKLKLPTIYSLKTVLHGEDGRNLRLKSPILTSSGCFEYDNQEKGKIDLTYVGAIVEKGLTLEPRAGNSSPRICEVKTGMLNSIGLENIGIKRFIREKLPRLKKAGIPVIANLSGFSAKEYAEGAAMLNDSDVDAIEVNISCPNISQGKEIFGKSATMTREVIRMVRYAAKDKFLITKHTPMAPDINEIVRVSVDEGSDAVSLINTILGMSIDIHTRRPRIAMKYGGYSGPGIMPIGLQIVNQVFECLKPYDGVPIIGMGGIENADDAIQYLLGGANAVAVGTGVFKNHNVFTEIYQGIEEYLNKHNYVSVEDIVGKVAV